MGARTGVVEEVASSKIRVVVGAASGKIVAMTQELDKVNTLAARIIVWAYGLLIMVVIATYTGTPRRFSILAALACVCLLTPCVWRSRPASCKQW